MIMDVSEEFADILTDMAISYEKESDSQGRNPMASAFLDGYQSAVSHLLINLKSQLMEDTADVYDVQYCLAEIMKAFELLTQRGEVQPSIRVRV